MTKLAANLTMLFNEVDFLDRFGEAANAGFKGVEFLFPYAFEAGRIAEQLDRHRLQLVLHNLPAGNWEAGERGIACDPARSGEFQDGVDKAINYARALGVKQLNCLVGIKPANVTEDKAYGAVVDNLRFAAKALLAHDIGLLIEPINRFDIPGFYLNGTEQALNIIAETGSHNIKVQYDIYHMQRMEGELAATIGKHLAKIGHIQLADNPGRFEPGTGEINYRYLLPMLDEIGYTGWVGLEYKPKNGTAAGLKWIAEHGVAL
jgi:hydroxypyruvate isomerase